jgi:hypothetical protein
MKPRNARVLDDLINGTNRDALYKHIRDGHVDDIAEIVGGLEVSLPLDRTTEALVTLVHMLLETRDAHGLDETRRRDKLIEKLHPEQRAERQPNIRAKPLRVRFRTSSRVTELS